MGMDAYADIYFGFPVNSLPWQSYDSDDEYEDEEPEDRLVRLLGFIKPTVPYDTDENKEIHRASWAVKRELEASQPCELVSDHSDYGDPAYHVSCKRAHVHTSWDEDKQFDPSSFGDEAVMTEEIRSFCELMGIEFQQPGWYLAARYS